MIEFLPYVAMFVLAFGAGFFTRVLMGPIGQWD